jgi:hypothetical protein
MNHPATGFAECVSARINIYTAKPVANGGNYQPPVSTGGY